MLTDDQRKLIYSLRSNGYAVVIWTPDEIGDADADVLEDIVVERGNNFLESVQNIKE